MREFLNRVTFSKGNGDGDDGGSVDLAIADNADNADDGGGTNKRFVFQRRRGVSLLVVHSLNGWLAAAVMLTLFVTFGVPSLLESIARGGGEAPGRAQYAASGDDEASRVIYSSHNSECQIQMLLISAP